MEIEEMEATMTPPLPQVEQPSNQLSQLLLSPYAEIESYISSLPKKEQLTMVLNLTRQFTMQRDTMFQQTYDHVSQLDHLNAQLMTSQLQQQHFQLQHDSLQAQLEKVTHGTTFLTSYTSDPLTATGPTGLNELNSFLASESNSLLYNKGTAVVIPKQLKGNEITDLTDKAIRQIRTKVTDFHTLRQFQREASNFFATAGYHAISQLLTTEGDLTQLTAKYHSFYQPLRNDSISATDFDKALIQDNDILLQFISKSFNWNSTIRSKIRTFALPSLLLQKIHWALQLSELADKNLRILILNTSSLTPSRSWHISQRQTNFLPLMLGFSATATSFRNTLPFTALLLKVSFNWRILSLPSKSLANATAT